MDALDLGGAFRLGQDDSAHLPQALAQRQVVAMRRVGGGIDADPDPEVRRGEQCLFEGVTCGRLGGFGDRILQVHDHHIGTTRQGLADSLRARRRDEQGGARIGGKRVGAGDHGAPRWGAAARATGS